MSTNVARSDDVERLQAVFGAYPEIQAVFLFGSQASGAVHAESDLDLAVVPRSSAARDFRLDILADLTRQGFDNVDLVFLDSDDIVLRHQAVRLNRLVYQVRDFDRGAFYSRVIREYLDFLPYLEVQREAYKRRLLRGQS